MFEEVPSKDGKPPFVRYVMQRPKVGQQRPPVRQMDHRVKQIAFTLLLEQWKADRDKVWFRRCWNYERLYRRCVRLAETIAGYENEIRRRDG